MLTLLWSLDSKITAYAFNHPRPNITELDLLFSVAEVCLIRSSQTLKSSLIDDKQIK